MHLSLGLKTKYQSKQILRERMKRHILSLSGKQNKKCHMAWSQAVTMPRVLPLSPCLPSLPATRLRWGRRVILDMLQVQHLLVLTPFWGCGGRLLCQKPTSWE